MINGQYLRLAQKYGLSKVPATAEELLAALQAVLSPQDMELVQAMLTDPVVWQQQNPWAQVPQAAPQAAPTPEPIPMPFIGTPHGTFGNKPLPATPPDEPPDVAPGKDKASAGAGAPSAAPPAAAPAPWQPAPPAASTNPAAATTKPATGTATRPPIGAISGSDRLGNPVWINPGDATHGATMTPRVK